MGQSGDTNKRRDPSQAQIPAKHMLNSDNQINFAAQRIADNACSQELTDPHLELAGWYLSCVNELREGQYWIEIDAGEQLIADLRTRTTYSIGNRIAEHQWSGNLPSSLDTEALARLIVYEMERALRRSTINPCQSPLIAYAAARAQLLQAVDALEQRPPQSLIEHLQRLGDIRERARKPRPH